MEEFVAKVKEISSRNNYSSREQGFKTREGKNDSKHFKGWVEHTILKRKKIGGSKTLRIHALLKY